MSIEAVAASASMLKRSAAKRISAANKFASASSVTRSRRQHCVILREVGILVPRERIVPDLVRLGEPTTLKGQGWIDVVAALFNGESPRARSP